MGLRYYNYDKLYSYNATYNFLVGGRGLGKTYGAKKKVLNAAITKSEQFIYLRRYKTELATARSTFFADIEHEFPNYDFKVNGPLALFAPVSTRSEKKREWFTMGYFIALSTSQMQKSVAFPKVKTIIYDEFIIERGNLHYLPEEATVFNNFYSTVDRYTDKTKVLFLANSVSIMNPYFLEYGIMPDETTEWITKNGGFIVAHFPDSKDFNNGVYETKFGKFIQNTEYAKYAVENTFSDNHDSLLDFKDAKAKYLYTLECKTGSFSVWENIATGQYFVQEKKPKSQTIFTIVPEKMSAEKVLLTFTDRPLAYLRTAFRTGKVNFDKPATRNSFTDIFKR